MHQDKINFKVKSDSNVHSCAVSLVKMLQDEKKVEISACGAGAVNQAVKILVKARGMFAAGGTDLYVVPGMRNFPIKRMRDGVEREEELSVVLFNLKVM